MTTIDQTWSEATTFGLVWPLEMPDRSTILAACREVAGTSPHHVIACDSDDVAGLMAEASGHADALNIRSAAFAVFHSSHGLAFTHSHARGDAYFSAELRDRLMSAMGVGVPPAHLVDRPVSVSRCGAALLAHWAGDLRRPVRALRFLQARRGSVRRQASSDRPAPLDAADPRTTFVVVPVEEIVALRATLVELEVEVSVSMALLYAIWSVHAGTLTPAHPATTGRMQVMVGLRRYSRLLGKVRGNMVGRLVLAVPGGTVAGLADFAHVARTWIDSAEPLLLHAAKVAAVRLRSLAATVRGGPGRQWESSWREGGVDLVWSDCGTGTGLAETEVRWSPDHGEGQRQAFMLARPVGPGLGVNVSWVGRSACLCLNHDAGQVDVGPVLAMLGDSPARYLRSMATTGRLARTPRHPPPSPHREP